MAPPGAAPGYPPPYGAPPGYPPPPGYGPPGYGYWGQVPDNMGSGRYRAQGIAELIDSAFTLYRRNLRLMLSIGAIPIVLKSVVEIVLAMVLIGPIINGSLVAPSGRLSNTAAATFIGGFAVYIVVVLVIDFVFQALLQGTLTQAVSQRYLGRPTSFGDSFKVGLSRFWPLLGYSGILILVIFVAAIVAVIFALVTIGIGLLLLIPGAIALWLVFGGRIAMTIVPCVVVERLGPIAALKRSWALTKGNGWRGVGFYLITVLVAFILGITFGGISSAFGLSYVLQQVFTAVVTVIVTPFTLIAYTLYYFDLRIRRENFDLEMLAEQV